MYEKTFFQHSFDFLIFLFIVKELFQCKRKATLQLGSTGNSIEKIVVIQEFASVLVLSSGDYQLTCK